MLLLNLRDFMQLRQNARLVMRNLELLGTQVIPHLERRGHRVDYKALFGEGALT